jgi:hypothetical protein
MVIFVLLLAGGLRILDTGETTIGYKNVTSTASRRLT